MLEEKIMVDFKDAMKNKDALKQSVISFLRSQLKNIAIEKKKDKLDDNDVIAVIKKQIKQRNKSIEAYGSAGRQDLVDQETAELKVLEEFLQLVEG